MKKSILIALFTLLLSNWIFPQNKKELKRTFIEANSYYLYGNYQFANDLFLIIYGQNPDNSNLAYKIGNCYLNTPFEKSKAIPYLENAVQHTDYKANENSYRETQAPLEAYFVLGNAYRVNGNLEKAISTYHKFKSLISEENPMVNSDFIDQEIQATENAIIIMKSPVFFIEENLGKTINISSINFRPAVSGDKTTLVYTCKFGEDNLIYYAKKENYDGAELYFYKEDEFIGNIYVSTLIDGIWSNIKKLSNNINTKFYESHASISRDNKTLFFASNREGGFGGLDIYKSERLENGEWGKAENLGSTINTAFNETSPFISENDSVLFFSSEGHYNMGGFDIFKSYKKGNDWSIPENIGYPINSTDNDLFFQPIDNGKTAYYSMTKSYKVKDIYKLDFTLPVFQISGNISVEDTSFTSFDIIEISAVDSSSNTIIKTVRPESQTGFYTFDISFGNHKIIYKGEGLLTHNEFLEILPEYSKEKYIIDISLELDSTYEKIQFEPIIVSDIPTITSIDTANLITDIMVMDPDSVNLDGQEILYFTVQLMALLNPVDVKYFHDRGFKGTKVLYGRDEFYRYIYDEFAVREDAEKIRQEVIKMGYLDVFVKTVYKETLEKNIFKK
jgi:tetratricopeptide (TPR) repeat protein